VVHPNYFQLLAVQVVNRRQRQQTSIGKMMYCRGIFVVDPENQLCGKLDLSYSRISYPFLDFAAYY
ncbi:MAG: hypothetical protein ABJA70_21805, partial [Chryseolinea sp.]